VEAEYKYFDTTVRKQLEDCLYLESLTDALEQKYCQFLSPEKEFTQWHIILHFNCSLLLLGNQTKQGPTHSVDRSH